MCGSQVQLNRSIVLRQVRQGRPLGLPGDGGWLLGGHANDAVKGWLDHRGQMDVAVQQE